MVRKLCRDYASKWIDVQRKEFRRLGVLGNWEDPYMQFIPQHRPITVIAGLFDLVNIRNRGAAFGFLNRSDIEWQFWLFLAATVVAVWAIVMLSQLGL